MAEEQSTQEPDHRLPTPGPEPGPAPTLDNGKKPEEDYQDGGSLNLDTVATVKWCDWKNFKNRYSAAVHAIEVLKSSDDLELQIQAEQLRRMTKEQREKYMAGNQNLAQRGSAYTTSSELGFDRIRINCSIILGYLGEVSDNSKSWTMQSHTFLNPFAILIYYQDAIRSALARLRQKLDARGGDDSTNTAAGFPAVAGALTRDERLAVEMVSDKAYQHLKCYVDFVEDNLIPHYRRFEKADHNNPKKIRFDDLWCLFRYGELLFRRQDKVDRADGSGAGRGHADPVDKDTKVPDASDGLARASGSSADTHTVLRACFVITPGETWEIDSLDMATEGKLGRNGDSQYAAVRATIQGYYIDYDGSRYWPVIDNVRIPIFRGEMDINSLPIFPVRFLRNHKSLLKKYRDQGAEFRKLIMKSRAGHGTLSHDGWSLTRHPLGEPLPRAPTPASRLGIWSLMEEPEYIESDIIIDFAEVFQKMPKWSPQLGSFDADLSTIPETVYDRFPIISYVDSPEGKRVREVVVDDDGIDCLKWNTMAKEDFLFKHSLSSGDSTGSREAQNPRFTDEDLMLLPSRVMAYALRDRRFFAADIKNIRQTPWPGEEENPFNALKIKKGHKETILALVKEHFDKKRLAAKVQQRGGGLGEMPDQDFIRGKGKGLVILLHGAPGVGKTATAEAVSLRNRRPLFLITCGDLGVDPETVESQLKQIFRLANLWDCILLLDEADIFLSQRQKGDESIKRNAMVSIFLRTLEYYPGILFLTTNRVGVIDEAVKSRVHVSLHYPALGQEETNDLFRMNIKRLKIIEKARADALRAGPVSSKEGQGDGDTREMIIREKEIMAFAWEHFNRDPAMRWNGRQIRNAFQIAASLARNEPKDRLSKRRGKSHKGENDDDWEQDDDPEAERAGEEGEDEEGSALYIGRKHFLRVAEVTADFDRERQRIHGKTDNELALEREERALERDSYSRGGQRYQDRRAPPPQRPYYPEPPNRGDQERGYGDDGWDERYRGGGGDRRGPRGQQYDRGDYHESYSRTPSPPRRRGHSPRRDEGARSRGYGRGHGGWGARHRSRSRSRSRSESKSRRPSGRGGKKERVEKKTVRSLGSGSEAAEGSTGGRRRAEQGKRSRRGEEGEDDGEYSGTARR